jgi:hypothetical protein
VLGVSPHSRPFRPAIPVAVTPGMAKSLVGVCVVPLNCVLMSVCNLLSTLIISIP